MAAMSKLGILLKQLYKQKIRSKGFILTTILYVAIICGFTFWSNIKEVLFSNEPEQVAILNGTDLSLQETIISDSDYSFQFLDQLPGDLLESGEYTAAIAFTDEGDQLKATFTSFDPLDLTTEQDLSAIVANVSQYYTISHLQLSDEQANYLLSAAPIIETKTLNEALQEGKSVDEKQAGIWVSYVIGFLIYFFITSYLSMITTDVASEKGSRALEMLLVSVKPEVHFRSKLFGTFLIAFTQLIILGAILFTLFRFTDNGAKWDAVLSIVNELSLMYFIYVILFLLATISLYLIIGALFGSLVSKVEEAGQVMMPAMLITIVGFYVMITGMANPDTMLIKVFSYIPFTSGMVMPMRIGATDLATFEPIISLALLLATVVLLYIISISFYKRSVLTYTSGGVIQKIKTVFKVTT